MGDTLGFAKQNTACCLGEFRNSLCRLGIIFHSLWLQLSSVAPVHKPPQMYHGTPHLMCAPSWPPELKLRNGWICGWENESAHLCFPGPMPSSIFKANRPLLLFKVQTLAVIFFPLLDNLGICPPKFTSSLTSYQPVLPPVFISASEALNYSSRLLYEAVLPYAPDSALPMLVFIKMKSLKLKAWSFSTPLNAIKNLRITATCRDRRLQLGRYWRVPR